MIERSRVFTSAGFLFLFIAFSNGYSQSTCVERDYAVNSNFTINVSLGSGWSSSPDLQAAFAFWEACGTYSTGFASFVAGGTGGIPVTLDFSSARNPVTGGTCGEFDPEVDSYNTLVSGQIRLFAFQNDNTPCASSSQEIANLIAHELGHALGLGHSSCSTGLMSANQWDATAAADWECTAADEQWNLGPGDALSNPEVTPPPPPTDPTACHCCSCSYPEPLVLDLNGDGIHTSGLSSPVWFDLDADGRLDLITWTDPSTGEGFLWVDLVPNNRVDDGRELFGIGTTLPSGEKASNGFEALAVYDSPIHGGNGDGIIDRQDLIWGRLRLWTDRDHDGISDSHEMIPIHASQVREIELSYSVDATPDVHGNIHLFRGTYRKFSPGLGATGRETHSLHGLVFQRVADSTAGTAVPVN